MNPSRRETADRGLFLVGRKITLESIRIAGRAINMEFADQFAKNPGQPLIVNGHEVVAMMRRTVLPDSQIRLIWRSARPLPVQGISVTLRGGKLSVNGADLKDVVLWRDTAPDEVLLVCHARKPVELLIWNCWRIDRDVTMAWVGNAAMRVVETGPNSVSVACNSRHEITIADLVFDVTFEAR